MGRKLNLSHLSEQECQRILAVVQRDFELRQREQARLGKIEGELSEKASKRSVLAKRKEFNEKCCILCCSTFNLLFNKKLPCRDCHFYVCRNCATWDSQDKVWICRVCEKQRVLYAQSCKWFYDRIRQRFRHFGSAKVLSMFYEKRKESADSENDSGYGPSPSVVSNDGANKTPRNLLSVFSAKSRNSTKHSEAGDSVSLADDDNQDGLAEVRQHIETVVEGLIGGPLDTAFVDCLCSHSDYLKLLTTYRYPLVETVSHLSHALYQALHKMLADSKITPTSAHAALKQIILEITENALKLPILNELDFSFETSRSPSPALSSDGFGEDVLPSYEDLLAMAIINKIVEQSQKRVKDSYSSQESIAPITDSDHLVVETNRIEGTSPTIPLKSKGIDVGVQSEIPEEIHTSDTSSDRDGSSGKTSSYGEDSMSDDHSWTRNGKDDDPPLKYVVEECIEEVTEAYTDSEDDLDSRCSFVSSDWMSDGPLRRKTSLNADDVPNMGLLYDWNFNGTQKAAFPELGLDIVEDEELTEDDIHVRLSAVSAWEDNWLFRKKRLLAARGGLGYHLLGNYYDPIYMLIPNPTESIRTQIGNREIDDISDLSERNSVGSIEFSDSDLEDDISPSHCEASPELLRLTRTIVSEFGHHLDNANCRQDIGFTSYRDSVPTCHDRPVPKPRTKVAQPPAKAQQAQTFGLQAPVFLPAGARKPSTSDLKFIQVPNDLVLHAGKTARFVCEVKGSLPHGVAWFKGNEQLQEGGCHLMYAVQNIYTLEIYDTCTASNATYSCVAFNRTGEVWTDFTLQVKPTTRATCRPDFVVPLRVVENEANRRVKLSCTVSGYPEPQLHIVHGQDLLKSGNQYLIENKGYGEWVVEITNPGAENEGDYHAVVINSLGQATCSVILTLGHKEETSAKPTEKPKTISTVLSGDMGGQTAQPAVTDETPAQQMHTFQDFNSMPVNPSQPHVVQRTWPERVAELEQNTRTHLYQQVKSAVSGISRAPSFKDTVSSRTDAELGTSESATLNTPPRPGTIAEREHLKWQNAVPLPNNPYSPENIARRNSLKGLPIPSVQQSLSYVEYERQLQQLGDTTDGSLLNPETVSRLRKEELNRYQRDYYINHLSHPPKRRWKADKTLSRDAYDYAGPEEALNSLEEKVYISAGKVFSLEDHVRQLEQEVQAVTEENVDFLEQQVARAAEQVALSNQQVSKVEGEVAKLQRSLRETPANMALRSSKTAIPSQPPLSFTDRTSTRNGLSSVDDSLRSCTDDEDSLSLPSVKDLATKFFSPPDSPPSPAPRSPKKHLFPEKKVIVVEKTATGNGKSGRNTPSDRRSKVHSLTARSLSREFREKALRNLPRPMNRTVTIALESNSQQQPLPLTNLDLCNVPAQDSETSSPSLPRSPVPPLEMPADPAHGYTSDESTASNTSLPRQKTRRRASRSILQRASFWERRVEQGLLSDTSVTEDFPPMQQFPD